MCIDGSELVCVTDGRAWSLEQGPTYKLDLPHTVRQQQAVGAEGAHLGTHLTKDRLGAVWARQTTFTARALHLGRGGGEYMCARERE